MCVCVSSPERRIDNLPPPSSLSPSSFARSPSSLFASAQPASVFLQPPAYTSHRPSQADQLIPIRLDCVVGHQRYEDTFLWSLYESTITPRLFCVALCNDVGLPHAFLHPLVQQMKEQIRRYKRLLRDKEEREASSVKAAQPARARLLRLLRLRLDLTLDGLRLSDQFLWDPAHPSASPEEFGRVLAAELGLTGEWAALIAWSVRDQLTRWAEGGDADMEWPSGEGDAYRQGDEQSAWGPVLEEVYSRLEHVDSQGQSSVGVEGGQGATEYEKEKERDRAAQKQKRREEKERERERLEREKQLQQTQQQQRLMEETATPATALAVNFARYAQPTAATAVDPFRFHSTQ